MAINWFWRHLLFLSCTCSVLLSHVLAKKPNILFILTDDQDWHYNSLDYMPHLQRHLVDEGTLFTNHYCTVSICCPSRVNIWTGKAAHNTNVTNLFPPWGGYPKFVEQGLNDDWLPHWLEQAGYSRYYVGKFLNSHSVDNYDAPYVKGFTNSSFLLDPYTYEYYNGVFTHDGRPLKSYKGQYSPDLVTEFALEYLEDAAKSDKPFFLAVAPIAPHGNVKIEGGLEFGYPKYADRHAHLFKDYKIPRDAPNFNPKKQGVVSWLKDLALLNDTVLEYNDGHQRARLRALQSVDEGIERLVKSLEDKKLLDDTYIIYTTDNGYHLSSYRLAPGKELPFDTDVHIPLIIRGPNVPRGKVSDIVTSHTDLAPTVLKIAGVERADFDGIAIPLTKTEEKQSRFESVNLEFWGQAIGESKYANYGHGKFDPNVPLRTAADNNTYKGLRLIGEDYSILYTVWCTGEKEYYDTKLDPGQIDNYFSNTNLISAYKIAGRPFKHIVNRLDALLLVLKSCKGWECVDPWRVLHPRGQIKTLNAALATEFDAFYHEQPKVAFSKCELGYIKDSEGPQLANVYGGESSDARIGPDTHLEFKRQVKSFDYEGHWSLYA